MKAFVELSDAEFEALSLDDQSTYLTNQTRHDAAVKANYTRTLLKLDDAFLNKDDRLAAIVRLILFPSPDPQDRDEYYKDGDDNFSDAVEAVEILTDGQANAGYSSSAVWNYVHLVQARYNKAVAEVVAEDEANAQKAAVTNG